MRTPQELVEEIDLLQQVRILAAKVAAGLSNSRHHDLAAAMVREADALKEHAAVLESYLTPA